MTDDLKGIVARHIEAFNARDEDGFPWSPDLEFVGPGGAHLRGLDEVVGFFHGFWEAFPDARLQPTGPRLTDGTHASAPAKLLGTHRGAVEGLTATNRFVVVHVVFFAELRDERLYRVRAFFDAYGAAVSLGVLPRPGTLGEKALLMLRGFGLRA